MIINQEFNSIKEIVGGKRNEKKVNCCADGSCYGGNISRRLW